MRSAPPFLPLPLLRGRRSVLYFPHKLPALRVTNPTRRREALPEVMGATHHEEAAPQKDLEGEAPRKWDVFISSGCRANCHGPSGLDNRHSFLTVVEAAKSKVKAWDGSVPAEGPLPALQMATFSPVLTWPFLAVHVGGRPPVHPSYKGAAPIIRVLPS